MAGQAKHLEIVHVERGYLSPFWISLTGLLRLRAFLEVSRYLAHAPRALALGGDGPVDSTSSIAGLNKHLSRKRTAAAAALFGIGIHEDESLAHESAVVVQNS